MTIKVFLVEDLRHLQGIVADLLVSLGDFEVIAVASTEAEANLWLMNNAGEWDLAVIDLVLAEGTGLGVIAKCNGRPPAAKVVVFSDYVSPGIRKHCLKLGADEVIAKGEIPVFVEYCSKLAANPGR